MRARIPNECAEMVYDLFDSDHNGTLDIFEFSEMIGSNDIILFLTTFLSLLNSSLWEFVRFENGSSV